MAFNEHLSVLPQYLLPHHGLSRACRLLSHCDNKLVKNFLIQQFVNLYQVNMTEALNTDINSYQTFNEFFTRALKPDCRPVASDKLGLVSPADGLVSQAGRIIEGCLIQAKGFAYTAQALLGGGSALAETFNNGLYTTIYLSPKDYHRLHMPMTGTLTEMIHVPGRLFSVNTATANTVPGLYARNERVCCIFDTEFGTMALVLVGAMIVNSIETIWHGVVTPPTRSTVQRFNYPNAVHRIEKGQEFGRFNMGSTIIMLLADDNKASWGEGFQPGNSVKQGESIGRYY